MNVLERVKAIWMDKRLAEMREEHDKEMEYTVKQYRRKLEVVEGERDAARTELHRMVGNLQSLLRSHGGGDVSKAS